MMQKVGIQTTQNVLIDYEVAGLGDRIAAYLLDLLLTGTCFVVLGLYNAKVAELPLWLNIALIVPLFLYHLLCEIFLNGQSLGKRQLHLKVVRLDGTQPGLGNYLLRWLLRPIDIWVSEGAIAIITILINGKGQRLGDMAAGTTLVKYKPEQHNFDSQLYKPIEDEDYDVQFPQVSRLREQDVALIRETLRSYRLTANAEPVQIMAEKAQQLLNIETQMPPLKLLHTLVKDYEHLSSRP